MLVFYLSCLHVVLDQVLETLLQEWHRDPTNKVLIFTKSVKLLEMLEFHLKGRRKESLELHIGLTYQEPA
jgi:SNF2 family DNA or RNA helicase